MSDRSKLGNEYSSQEQANAYSSNRDIFSDTDKRLISTLEKIGVAGKRILDLGCGNGEQVCKVANMGARRVIGVDLNLEMVKLAQKIPHPENTYFVVANGDKLPLPDTSQDIVFSSFVFHYFKDSEGLFQEMSRILVPGGSLVSTFNVVEVEAGSEALYNTLMPIRLGTKVIVENLIKSREEILKSIEKSGFDIVEGYEIDNPNSTVEENFKWRGRIKRRAMLYVLKKR